MKDLAQQGMTMLIVTSQNELCPIRLLIVIFTADGEFLEEDRPNLR